MVGYVTYPPGLSWSSWAIWAIRCHSTHWFTHCVRSLATHPSRIATRQLAPCSRSQISIPRRGPLFRPPAGPLFVNAPSTANPFPRKYKAPQRTSCHCWRAVVEKSIGNCSSSSRARPWSCFDKSLPDPKVLLKGSGSKVRSLILKAGSDLDRGDVKALVKATIKHSGVTFPRAGSTRLVSKSVSKKQKPQRTGTPDNSFKRTASTVCATITQRAAAAASHCVSHRRKCPLASKSLIALLVLFVSSPFARLSSAATPEESCANASSQSQNLRVEKAKNGTTVEILDKSAHWRVVFRSVAEINLPRQSPDANFLAYVSSERGSPWLYLQRLSTSANEPVSSLDSNPINLCFDSTASVLHVVFSSGAVTDYDISPQLRLLPGR